MGIGMVVFQVNVDFVLDNLELCDYFVIVKYVGDVIKGKFDLEIYQLVVVGLGILVKDCVIFEDSFIGVEVVYNVGSLVIVVIIMYKLVEFSYLFNVLVYIEDFNVLEYDI